MRKPLTWAVAVILGTNGLAMLLLPETWYRMVPSVPPTGPFNPHFVRDIGLAYLVCSWALIWFVLDPLRGAAAAIAAAVLQIAHSFLHVWDLLAGRATLNFFLQDCVLVVLPALLMLWLAWPGAATHDALTPAR